MRGDGRSGQGGNNTAAAIQFAGAALTGPVTSSGSSLDLSIRSLAASGGFNGSFDVLLYGILDNAAEDELDDDTYTAADSDAFDQTSDSLRNTFIFDPNPATASTEPIASRTFASVSGNNDTTLTFSGADFDAFLSTVTQDVSDDTVAFALVLPDLAGENIVLQIDSAEFNRGAPGFAPTLNVVPEPSTMALAGLGALAMLRRRKG